MRHKSSLLAFAIYTLWVLPSNSEATDLCLDGLCIVRAQVLAHSSKMTTYSPLFLTFENRSESAKRIVEFQCEHEIAATISILHGDEWDPQVTSPILIRPREYKQITADTSTRVMLIGLNTVLVSGQTFIINLVLDNQRNLAIPVSVIARSIQSQQSASVGESTNKLNGK